MLFSTGELGSLLTIPTRDVGPLLEDLGHRASRVDGKKIWQLDDEELAEVECSLSTHEEDEEDEKDDDEYDENEGSTEG